MRLKVPSAAGRNALSVAFPFLSFLLYCVVKYSSAVQEDDDYGTPYLLVAFNDRIDRLHMNGSFAGTVCYDYIEAIDYHYRMQHVYWIDWYGQIKRARLNGTDSSTNEIVAYELTGPKDIAVDWIENRLYWTSGENTMIGFKDITSNDAVTEETAEHINVANMSSGAFFTRIFLDPINRTLYVLEASNNHIIELRGGQTRPISIQSGQICCPALSFPYNAIMWFDAGSTVLRVQRLTNTSLAQSYSVNRQHVNEIVYFDGKIYWSQKDPMGIFYKHWEMADADAISDSDTIAVVEYDSYMIISDFKVVDPSKQPLTVNDYATHASENERLTDHSTLSPTAVTTSIPMLSTLHSTATPSLTITSDSLTALITHATSTRQAITTQNVSTLSATGVSLMSVSTTHFRVPATTAGAEKRPLNSISTSISVKHTTVYESTPLVQIATTHMLQSTTAQVSSLSQTSVLPSHYSAQTLPLPTSQSVQNSISHSSNSLMFTSASPENRTHTATAHTMSAFTTTDSIRSLESISLVPVSVTPSTDGPVKSQNTTLSILHTTTPLLVNTFVQVQESSSPHSQLSSVSTFSNVIVTSISSSIHASPVAHSASSFLLPIHSVEPSAHPPTSQESEGTLQNLHTTLSVFLSTTTTVSCGPQVSQHPSATAPHGPEGLQQTVHPSATAPHEPEESQHTVHPSATAPHGPEGSQHTVHPSATAPHGPEGSQHTVHPSATAPHGPEGSLHPSATAPHGPEGSQPTILSVALPHGPGPEETQHTRVSVLPHITTITSPQPASFQTEAKTIQQLTATTSSYIRVTRNSTSSTITPPSSVENSATITMSINVLPSLGPITPDSSDGGNTTLEAIAITSACLGIAVLVFIGLAVSDAIYYFSYERKLGKNASSGLLGVVWRLITLPFHCISAPRYILRKRRRSCHPYVPRCMNRTDISTYVDPNQAVSSTSATSATENSGTLSDNVNNITDMSILSQSGDDGTSETASMTDHVAASIQSADANCSNSYGDIPLTEVTKLELETKIALDILELEDKQDEVL